MAQFSTGEWTLFFSRLRPHAALELPLVPRTHPASDSDLQHSDSLSGLWGVGKDLSGSSQTLVLPY